MPAISSARSRADGKKKIRSSMSGNRTRGVCVTGRNVTNYTNTDLSTVERFETLPSLFVHPYRAGVQPKSISLIIRSYHGGSTASRPNCEVKHLWAQSVLRWGTTRESWVLNVLFPQIFFSAFFFCESIFFFSVNQLFSGRHTTQKQGSHHSIIPWWIYRIPSELRSQAPLGPISTAVGDHAGILGVECFFFL